MMDVMIGKMVHAITKYTLHAFGSSFEQCNVVAMVSGSILQKYLWVVVVVVCMTDIYWFVVDPVI